MMMTCESIMLKNSSQSYLDDSIVVSKDYIKPVKIESDLKTVKIETNIKRADATQYFSIEIDHDEFVKLFIDPCVELSINNMDYLIGYKMVYSSILIEGEYQMLLQLSLLK